jgi:predicted DNA binding CopG/RHH family protein
VNPLIILKLQIRREGDKVKEKTLTLRLPEELLNALRRRAAEETIKHNRTVSINTVAVEMLSKAVGLKGKKSTS